MRNSKESRKVVLANYHEVNRNFQMKGIKKISTNLIDHPYYLDSNLTHRLAQINIYPTKIDGWWRWNNYPNPVTVATICMYPINHELICPLFRKSEFEDYMKGMDIYFADDNYIVFKECTTNKELAKFVGCSPNLDEAVVRVLEQEYEVNSEYVWFEMQNFM